MASRKRGKGEIGRFHFTLPGEGPDPVIAFDKDRLMDIAMELVSPIIKRPFASKPLPALKPSTIERKKRAGYDRPEQPLVATGALERSVLLKRSSTKRKSGINVKGAEYFYYQRKSFRVGFWDEAQLMPAIDRAIKRFLREIDK